MAEPEFSDLERQFIRLSARRYQTLFFRWGHLLGWLALPLFALMFVPGFKPYAPWLGWAAIMLGFEWYFVICTRVIGKLQARDRGPL